MKRFYVFFIITVLGFVIGMAMLGKDPEWTAFIYWMLVSMWAWYGTELFYSNKALKAEIAKAKSKERVRVRNERKRPETMRIFAGLPERMKARERKAEQAKIYNGDFIKEM
ncbi:MAG: hypothetical protein LIO87_09215 [Eubacterium sp.]|nr:hypothetical protein [Eubacterium sp.]